MILVNIIIVNYNLSESVRDLIYSVQKNTLDLSCNIIVVDNNSAQRDIELLVNEFPDVKFEFLNTNFGFGHANNYAIKKYKSKYYLLLNPDTLLIEDTITELINFLEENENFAVASPITLNETMNIDFNYREFPNIFDELMNLFGLQEKFFRIRKTLEFKFSKKTILEPDFVYGSAMLLKADVFEQIGYFDEDYFLFAEETDLCYRLRTQTKYNIALLKNVKIIHSGGKIINRDKNFRTRYIMQSKLIFIKKNYSPLKKNILRFIIIISLIERIVIYSILSSDTNRKKVQMFKDLLKQYISDKPMLNRRLNDE
jgi:GT2 family glycosyltransferase